MTVEWDELCYALDMFYSIISNKPTKIFEYNSKHFFKILFHINVIAMPLVYISIETFNLAWYNVGEGYV